MYETHNKYPELKIHYRPTIYHFCLLCGLKMPSANWYNWTTNPEDVTCKRCLKKLERMEDDDETLEN